MRRITRVFFKPIFRDKWIMRVACIAIAFFAFSLLFQVSGQNSSDYLEAKGDSQFDLGYYTDALSYWSKIPNPNAMICYKMSNAYHRIGDNENEIYWRKESIRLDASINRKYSFMGEDKIDNGGTETSNKGDHLYPITWSFETGNCQGWIKKGSAFQNQPAHCENIDSNPGDQSLNYQGRYLIATSENCPGLSDVTGAIQEKRDKLTGELISLPFIIQGDSISFLLGGGKSCSVNLIVNDKIAHSATGNDTETMRRVEWNVSVLKRKTAQIIVVDNSSEEGGHISFDDVKFDVHPSVIERANKKI